jgi:hypothetical protein
MTAIVVEDGEGEAIGGQALGGEVLITNHCELFEEALTATAKLFAHAPKVEIALAFDMVVIPLVEARFIEIEESGAAAFAQVSQGGDDFGFPGGDVTDDVLERPRADEGPVDIADAAGLNIADQLIALEFEAAKQAAALIGERADIVLGH